jgi:hypothetical protein
MMFPAAFPHPPKVRIKDTNEKYHGWNVRENRLFFANGVRKFTLSHMLTCQVTLALLGDPWRDATVSADGIYVPSTSQQPIGLSDGFHCSDLGTASGLADPTVAAVQNSALAAMKDWLKEWKPTHNSSAKSIIEQSKPSQLSVSDNIQHSTKPINAFFKGAGSF